MIIFPLCEIIRMSIPYLLGDIFYCPMNSIEITLQNFLNVKCKSSSQKLRMGNSKEVVFGGDHRASQWAGWVGWLLHWGSANLLPVKACLPGSQLAAEPWHSFPQPQSRVSTAGQSAQEAASEWAAFPRMVEHTLWKRLGTITGWQGRRPNK